MEVGVAGAAVDTAIQADMASLGDGAIPEAVVITAGGVTPAVAGTMAATGTRAAAAIMAATGTPVAAAIMAATDIPVEATTTAAEGTDAVITADAIIIAEEAGVGVAALASAFMPLHTPTARVIITLRLRAIRPATTIKRATGTHTPAAMSIRMATGISTAGRSHG